MPNKTIISVKKARLAGIDWRNTNYNFYTTGTGKFGSALTVEDNIYPEAIHLKVGLSTFSSIWLSSGDFWIEHLTAGKSIKLFAGSGGQIMMPSLPTSDPSIAGALWNDGGTMKISAG